VSVGKLVVAHATATTDTIAPRVPGIPCKN
jgi:hypothetical protein